MKRKCLVGLIVMLCLTAGCAKEEKQETENAASQNEVAQVSENEAQVSANEVIDKNTVVVVPKEKDPTGVTEPIRNPEDIIKEQEALLALEARNNVQEEEEDQNNSVDEDSEEVEDEYTVSIEDAKLYSIYKEPAITDASFDLTIFNIDNTERHILCDVKDLDLYVCNDVRCEEDNSTYAFNGQGYSDKIEKGDTYNKNIFIQVDDYSRITSIRLTHDYVNSTKADDSFDLLENDIKGNTLEENVEEAEDVEAEVNDNSETDAGSFKPSLAGVCLGMDRKEVVALYGAGLHTNEGTLYKNKAGMILIEYKYDSKKDEEYVYSVTMFAL